MSADPCPYCGDQMSGTSRHSKKYPTRDHVTARSRGGKFTVIVCWQCNHDKANLPIQGWLGLLRRRNDPRAAFVAAFIEANSLRIRPIILSVPPPRVMPNIKHDNDNETKKPWVCNDCGRRFKMGIGADHHWQQSHNRKAS